MPGACGKVRRTSPYDRSFLADARLPFPRGNASADRSACLPSSSCLRVVSAVKRHPYSYTTSKKCNNIVLPSHLARYNIVYTVSR